MSSMTVARECVLYDWQKCSDNCTGTEICPGKQAHCYATWRNETGNITVLMQGCWLNSDDCYDHVRFEKRKWEENKPFYYCCNEDYCNTPDNLYYIPSPEIIRESKTLTLYLGIYLGACDVNDFETWSGIWNFRWFLILWLLKNQKR